MVNLSYQVEFSTAEEEHYGSKTGRQNVSDLRRAVSGKRNGCDLRRLRHAAAPDLLAKAKGCSVPNCGGKIQEMIEAEKTAARPPVQAQPVPAPAVSAAAKVSPAPRAAQPAGEALFTCTQPIVQRDAAAIIEKITLQKGATGGLFAVCWLQRISDRPITALMVDLRCKDAWGNEVEGVTGYQYLDVKAARGACFGETEQIPLPNPSTRSVSALIRKVLYADGQIEDCADETVQLSARKPLEEQLGSKELAEQFARETTAEAVWTPVQEGELWRCTCGSVNHASEPICPVCSSSAETLFALLNDPALGERLAAHEAALQEQAQQKRAEEERQEADRLAQEKKKKGKRILLIAALSVVVLAAAACLTMFLFIPMSKYQSANDALARKDFDTAFEIFTSLEDFGDSRLMATRTLYLKAEDLMENGSYGEAIALFQSLGNFDDAPDRILEAKYRQANAYLEAGSYTEAIVFFEALGNYEDSPELLKEATYLKADELQNDKKYKEAYVLFKQLGNYKESEKELLATLLLWEAEALSSDQLKSAQEFVDTVKLDSSQYELFYSAISVFIFNHTDASYWWEEGYWRASNHAKNTYNLLTLLPSTYKATSQYLELFYVLVKDGSIYDLFYEHANLVETMWSVAPFMQSLLEEFGSVMPPFMRGTWKGSGYYLTFTDQGDDGIYSSFDLPWVAKPSGTKYYEIIDMVYCWIDADNNRLADVFYFEIIDYNTINVFCYKNNRTYTMYRQ